MGASSVLVQIIFDVVVIIVFESVWKQQISFPESSIRKPPMFRFHPPDAIYFQKLRSTTLRFLFYLFV